MNSGIPEREDAWITRSALAPSGSGKFQRRSKASCSCEKPAEVFFTVEAVAKSLDVCDRTVRRWIEDKKLIAHDLEGIIRISSTDLQNFISRSRRS